MTNTEGENTINIKTKVLWHHKYEYQITGNWQWHNRDKYIIDENNKVVTI